MTTKKLVAWVEIPTTDFLRGVNFYNAVLKTELQIIDCGEEKMACFPGGEGAVIYAPGYRPSPDGVVVSLDTGNELDATMERVIANGGKILVPKTKIEVEGRGFFAIFTDCEGNRLGLYGN